MDELRILLIAPDPLARAALAGLLDDENGSLALRVVGRADGATDWEELLALHRPDIVLCDLGWQGSLALPDVRELDVPVVTLVADEEGAQSAWQAGVHGIVARSADGPMLTAALQAAHCGLLSIDRRVMPEGLAAVMAAGQMPAEPLTPREQEVLTLLARGLTNRAIAFELAISEHTVKFHVNALLSKLGAQSRTEAAVRATRLGLLTL